MQVAQVHDLATTVCSLPFVAQRVYREVVHLPEEIFDDLRAFWKFDNTGARFLFNVSDPADQADWMIKRTYLEVARACRVEERTRAANYHLVHLELSCGGGDSKVGPLPRLKDTDCSRNN